MIIKQIYEKIKSYEAIYHIIHKILIVFLSCHSERGFFYKWYKYNYTKAVEEIFVHNKIIILLTRFSY